MWSVRVHLCEVGEFGETCGTGDSPCLLRLQKGVERESASGYDDVVVLRRRAVLGL